MLSAPNILSYRGFCRGLEVLLRPEKRGRSRVDELAQTTAGMWIREPKARVVASSETERSRRPEASVMLGHRVQPDNPIHRLHAHDGMTPPTVLIGCRMGDCCSMMYISRDLTDDSSRSSSRPPKAVRRDRDRRQAKKITGLGSGASRPMAKRE